MIDHLLGRPSVSWKRTQVFLVIFFWIWRLRRGSADGPRVFWLRRINRACKRFTPWQIIIGCFTLLYAGRHLDSILGFGSPEPLARLYSRSYYRATWIATGLDAGFATAMTIKPKWFRDLCSVLFSAYYIIYANEADEKLRKFRAVATVEMLRTTWDKTTNPYLRLINAWDRPRITILRKILLARPLGSSSRRPIVAWLFFNGSEKELSRATDLILDFPGGGFICMSPQHHEERLRRWAIRCKRPVLSIDYGKAPEYPFPFAIEECFDVYRTLVYSKGGCIGMSGTKINVVMSGDSAGGTFVATVMYKILEHPEPLPQPVALVFTYAALDFNFTSWMSPANLRVLRSEQSTANLAGLAEQKDHYSHRSPLAVVKDTPRPRIRKHKSWTRALSLGNKGSVGPSSPISPTLARTRSMFKRKSNPFSTAMGGDADEAGNAADEEDTEDDSAAQPIDEEHKPIKKRVAFTEDEVWKQQQVELSEAVAEALTREKNTKKAPIGTRLTMTSRTGYFQDRVISPSMMRAMAILYIGPKRNPDFETDYYISPILGPSELLVQFPPLLMSCGEKDPFVDDTVIFAGRVREAKRALKLKLEIARRRGGKVEDEPQMTARPSKQHEQILNETDEDWVRLAIIEGWSHGFLQMSTLMPEAREAINRIGDWINDAFTSHSAATRHEQKGSCDEAGLIASSETETDEAIMFVPRKKRTSPPLSTRTDDDGRGRSVQISGGDQGRSSDETLIGGIGPVATAGYSCSSSGTDRVADVGLPGSLEPAGSPAALLMTELLATAGGIQRPAGTAGKAATLVSETDLLKRRREEAVFGIGNVRTVENPTM